MPVMGAVHSITSRLTALGNSNRNLAHCDAGGAQSIASRAAIGEPTPRTHFTDIERRRTSERGGVFWDYEKSISLGCPLSPLMGALFLKCLDERMAKSGLFYVRFMDDILVLSPTRWKLRNAVKVVNQVLGSLKLEKHPDKTFIGRIERVFDFLGYHFRPDRLSVAANTIECRCPCDPALRARAGGGVCLRPAWVVRGAVGRLGDRGSCRDYVTGINREALQAPKVKPAAHQRHAAGPQWLLLEAVDM